MKRMHTILVVEDESSVRKLICGLLKDNGYHVLETSNGKDALELAGRHPGPIHALLTDIVLTGPMDGLELGTEMRRIRPDIRPLFMSGYGGSFGERLELEALSDFFIAKPFSAKALIAMVESSLSEAPVEREMASAPRARPTLHR